MITNKFTRKTKGFNGAVFVAPAIDYTTDADIATFLANAPVGEMGVYDANNARHTDAITSAEKFYFVQRVSGGLKRTQEFSLGEITIRKKTYVAGTKQVSSIGYSGTGGNMNPPTIVAGQVYEFAIIETTEGYDPFPTWNYTYIAKTGDTAVDIMRAFAKQINNFSSLLYSQNQPLVTAKVKADATYGNFALTGTGTLTMVVTKGSANVRVDASGGTDGAIDAVVGDYISFDAAATPSDSVGNIYKVIAKVSGTDDTTLTLDRPYEGANQTFTEAEAEGTRVKKVTVFVAGAAGLELTAIDFNTSFKIVTRELLEDSDVNYTTATVFSNGDYLNVLQHELEGQVWEGDTAKNTVFASDYGQQDKFAVSTDTYDAYIISYVKRGAAIAPAGETVQRGNVVIWVARSAGNFDGIMDTLFGL